MDRIMSRLLGFFGGVVVAYASLLTIIAAARIFDWSWSLLLFAGVVCVATFPLLGVIFSRYFMAFAFVANFLLNDGDHSADIRDWDIFLLGVAEFFALLLLTSTILFPVPLVLSIGVVLFMLFAALAPWVMTDERIENYSGE